MQVQVRKLEGSWDLGYALHKHTLSSVYLGDDEHGHPRFDNTRSEPGKLSTNSSTEVTGIKSHRWLRRFKQHYCHCLEKSA